MSSVDLLAQAKHKFLLAEKLRIPSQKERENALGEAGAVWG